jgi:hypothetical protein
MNDFIIKRTPILTTTTVVYSAWERSAGICGQHSTVTSDDDGWLGRVGTRALTPELAALPQGRERWDAVDAYHEEQYQAAYAAIVAAHPEAAEGKRDMGEIVIYED